LAGGRDTDGCPVTANNNLSAGPAPENDECSGDTLTEIDATATIAGIKFVSALPQALPVLITIEEAPMAQIGHRLKQNEPVPRRCHSQKLRGGFPCPIKIGTHPGGSPASIDSSPASYQAPPTATGAMQRRPV
jgi:hypothetical protein